MRKVTRLMSHFLIVFLFFIFAQPGLPEAQAIQSNDLTYRAVTRATDFLTIKPMDGDAQIYEFCYNEQVVMRYRTMVRGLSAKDRALVIWERANNLGQALEEGEVVVGCLEGTYVVLLDNQLFITVTEADYQANNSTGKGLAKVWAHNLQKARRGEKVHKQDKVRMQEALQEKEPQKQELRRQELREQELREQELRRQELREQELREQELRKQELREQELRRQELREQELREQELREQELRRQELREQELRRQELRKQELREQELREQELREEESEAGPSEPVTEPVAIASVEELKMLTLINVERVKVGVQPLAMKLKLVEVARLKSQDMIDGNYFSHNSPTYGDPFTMMRNFGVEYGYAGENLAGNPSVENAHENLMESPGHKKNILNPHFTHVGIGIIDGGIYGKMCTQLFISER